MAIPGWDDEDDEFLCGGDWEAQERALIEQRRQAQQAPPSATNRGLGGPGGPAPPGPGPVQQHYPPPAATHATTALPQGPTGTGPAPPLPHQRGLPQAQRPLENASAPAPAVPYPTAAPAPAPTALRQPGYSSLMQAAAAPSPPGPSVANQQPQQQGYYNQGPYQYHPNNQQQHQQQQWVPPAQQPPPHLQQQQQRGPQGAPYRQPGYHPQNYHTGGPYQQQQHGGVMPPPPLPYQQQLQQHPGPHGPAYQQQPGYGGGQGAYPSTFQAPNYANPQHHQHQQQGPGALGPLAAANAPYQLPLVIPPAQQQQQQQQQAAALPVVTIWATLALPRSGGGGRAASEAAEAAAAARAAGRPAEPMFEVAMGRNTAADNALRALGAGGRYNNRRGTWLFPLSAHDRVVSALESATGVHVRVEPLHHLPAAVLRAAATVPDDSSRYCHIPSFLEVQLMEFQREGVKFALRHGGRALIGDEMGLGKTVQALALAAAYRDDWPGLIIAPSSLREAWADALHKWLCITESRIHIVHTGKDVAEVPARRPGVDFLVVSYNFLDKMDLAGKYKLVIADESHCIKDPGAKRTKAALPVLKGARRCFLLTGTPALNRPKEVYTQLAALVPGASIKMKDFGERYCKGTRFDRYGGAQNLDELHSMLRASIMVRRLKSEVLTQLPSKRRQQVFLALDAKARKQLTELSRELEAVKASTAALAAANAASNGAVNMGGGRMEENRAIMELYFRTAQIKVEAVCAYLDTLFDAGQKFLVFAHHKDLLDSIEAACNRRKTIRFIRIDGGTPAQDRSKLVSKFQDDADVTVAILSIKAAGVGLTLTAASTVVFAEMTWTPGEIIQAEDRAHRIGQAQSVNVYFLHARGSIDEIIWASLQNKLENVGQALDGGGRGGMEVAAARPAPERGQRALDTYLTNTQKEMEEADAAEAGARKRVESGAGAVGQENHVGEVKRPKVQ